MMLCKMWAFILLISISSIFAYESPVYRQEDWNNLSDSDDRPQDQYFEGIFPTRIDHFRPLNQTLINFRYNVNANFFVPGGPLYVYLKDFGDSTTRWIEQGVVVDVAKDTRAALLTFDTRYFGRNRPTGDTSLDNLELLTVEQTIGDISSFIRFIREYIGNNQYSTVILWGSGFGGSLAVWARKRFPTIINAAYASSGYFILEAYTYTPFDLLEYSLIPDQANTDCRDRLQTAYRTLDDLFREGDSERISTLFNLCEPIDTNNADDVSAFYETSFRALMDYINTYHHYAVTSFCINMRAILGDPLHSFARWIVHEYGDGSCYDPTFAALIARSGNNSWDNWGTDTGRRQQYYLECTQLGGFPVADNYTWIPQSVPLDYHLRKCSQLFGIEFTFPVLNSAVQRLYGEFQQSVELALYTNGMIDPMRFFGRMFDPMGISVNIDFHSKSSERDSIHLADPYVLYEAKRRIDLTLRQWSLPPPPPPTGTPTPPGGTPTGPPTLPPTNPPTGTPTPTAST